MVQKRPLNSDPKLALPSKNPRNENDNDDNDGSKLVSFSKTVLSEDSSNKPHPPGGDESSQDDTHGDDEETAAANGIAQERVCPGTENPNPNNPIRIKARLIDIYQSLFERSPLKSVALGPNHQADVPKWKGTSNNPENVVDPTRKSFYAGPHREADIPEWNSTKNNHESKAASGSKLVKGQEDERLFLGACILQMPNLDSNVIETVGKGRTDCSCRDAGFVKCVKQRIVETRDKPKVSLGRERFEQLGTV